VDQLLSKRSDIGVYMIDKYNAAIMLSEVYGLTALNNDSLPIMTNEIDQKVTEKMVIHHLRTSRNIAEISKLIKMN
jgi:hypothetical protein